METRYEAEKREQQLKLQETQLSKNEIEIKKKNLQRNAFIGGFILVLLLSIVVFRSYRQQKKQREIVDEKNRIIEQKNKDITDSIEYAKTIQEAILTSSEYCKQVLPQHFILFKPKDIVSGDFYWAYASKNNTAIWTVADCTGHGVPGAFMSMIGSSLLNEIIIEKGITSADIILNELKSHIIKALGPKGATGETKDGMDAALCIWYKDTNKLEFAGANNPLCIVRKISEEVGSPQSTVGNKEEVGSQQSRKDGISAPLQSAVGNNEEVGSPAKTGFPLRSNRQSAVGNEEEVGSQQSTVGNKNRNSEQKILNYELIEIKADKQPIGYEEGRDAPFTKHEIQLQKGDTIYTFSDGYKDQFGGPNDKKFSSKRFRELLISIQDKSMQEQKEILDETIEKWKGEQEQIDDICIIGVRV